MKGSILSLAVLLSAGACGRGPRPTANSSTGATPLASPLAERQTSQGVSGIVLDTGSGRPLPRVQFVAYANALRFVDSLARIDSAVALSDSSGRFAFDSLRSGEYTVWVRPPIGWCGPWSIHITVPNPTRGVLKVAIHTMTCEGDFCHC